MRKKDLVAELERIENPQFRFRAVNAARKMSISELMDYVDLGKKAGIIPYSLRKCSRCNAPFVPRVDRQVRCEADTTCGHVDGE